MPLTKVSYSMIEGDSANILDFGASPTNTASANATAIQAALDSGANSIYFPQGTFPTNKITVNNPCILFGPGVLKRSAVVSEALLVIDSSNVIVDGLTFLGNSENTLIPTTNTLDTAIQALGADSQDPLQNLQFKNCTVNGFAGFGIEIKYAEDVLADNNQIKYIGYAGIMYLSVKNGIMTKNRVSNVNSSAGAVNWYGVSLTRDASFTTAQSAVSENCIISDNIISDVPGWTGIDTHAPFHALITNNIVLRCRNGIYAQYDDSVSPNRQRAYYVTIANNYVQGNSDPSTNAIGIASLGLPGFANVEIKIDNNTVVKCGSYNDSFGAIGIRSTINCDVTNNNIREAVRVGISIDGETFYCNVINNSIDGVQDGAALASYMAIDQTDLVNCLVESNDCNNTSGNSAYTPTYGILYKATGGCVFSKNRIWALSGSNFIYRSDGGLANIYTDLQWQLEQESIRFNYVTTGGSPFESMGSRQSSFRRLPNTNGTFILYWNVTYDATNLTNNIYVRGSNGTVYTPAAYTVDGTNIGAGLTLNDVNMTLEGVYWTN